jgi:hypothetical protein
MFTAALMMLLAAPASATDVLVPTITPRSLSDFAPAERLTEEVLNQLSDKGVGFVPPSEIQKRAGEVADGCADLPQCTTILWTHFPQGRVAMVGSIEYEKGILHAVVRFYGPDDGSPIELVEERFPEAQIPAFAARLTQMSQEIIALVPARKAGGVVTAREPGRGGGAGAVNTYDDLDGAPEPAGSTPGVPPSEADEFERRTAGLPPRLWDRYKESGLSYEDWKEKALVRSGSLLLELHAGAVFGDVDRVYDTRVSFEEVPGEDGSTFTEAGAYQYESFVRGSGFMVGGAVGFAPLWWMEASLLGGVQIGHKRVSIGYESYEQGQVGQAEPAEIYSHSPAAGTAVMALIEPRIRFLTLPNGPVKPYILAGLTTRFYDAYDDPLLSGAVDYPKRQGGVSLGVTTGGGIAFDGPRGAIGFIEIPWTALISPKPYSDAAGTVINTPKQEAGANQLLAFKAGIGYRFD